MCCVFFAISSLFSLDLLGSRRVSGLEEEILDQNLHVCDLLRGDYPTITHNTGKTVQSLIFFFIFMCVVMN